MDPAALAELHRQVRPPLTRWLMAMARDRALAEDIASEAFLKLVRRQDTIYGNQAQVRSWLYQTARRSLLDHLRARRRRPEELGPVPEREATADDPLEAAVASEELRRVDARLAVLTEAQATAVVMRMAGLNSSEIARRLGISRASVEQLVFRARRTLRSRL